MALLRDVPQEMWDVPLWSRGKGKHAHYYGEMQEYTQLSAAVRLTGRVVLGMYGALILAAIVVSIV